MAQEDDTRLLNLWHSWGHLSRPLKKSAIAKAATTHLMRPILRVIIKTVAALFTRRIRRTVNVAYSWFTVVAAALLLGHDALSDLNLAGILKPLCFTASALSSDSRLSSTDFVFNVRDLAFEHHQLFVRSGAHLARVHRTDCFCGLCE